jgi:hypothetical protein
MAPIFYCMFGAYFKHISSISGNIIKAFLGEGFYETGYYRSRMSVFEHI